MSKTSTNEFVKRLKRLSGRKKEEEAELCRKKERRLRRDAEEKRLEVE